MMHAWRVVVWTRIGEDPYVGKKRRRIQFNEQHK